MDIETPTGDRPWSLQTHLIHDASPRTGYLETSEALFLTSGYVYTSAEEAEAAFATDGLRHVYSRYSNPTVESFERRLCAYEGAEVCFATGSGMAAVFGALASQLKAGDRVVASRALFGSCYYIVTEILPRWGIETVLVDGADLNQWADALRSPATLVFLESPSNPTLELVDLEAVSVLAHDAGAKVVVDNAFATPVLQKPMAFGADVVTYSATKHIDGQGRTLGGAILCSKEVAKQVQPFLRHTGPAMSPFNAWVMLKGLETLELRVTAMATAAHKVAAAVERLAGVSHVRHPDLESHPQHDLARRQMKLGGSIFAFDLDGGKDAAFRFLNHLQLIKISNNLGDAKSLATHPATTTHRRIDPEGRARIGITDGTVRVSIGLEDPSDLIADLTQALAA